MKTFSQFIIEGDNPVDVELTGVLKKTSDDFYYLDIDNKLIDACVKLVPGFKIEKPPYFKSNAGDVGAHISIIQSDELPNGDIKEVGKEFRFTWGTVKCVKPDNWDEMNKVYYIQVKSKQLEDLREKYGLERKYNGHEFHITFAVERKK